MKDFLYLCLGLSILTGSIYLFLEKPAADYYQRPIIAENKTVLKGEAASFEVEIADTEEERVRGLSGREGLRDGEGLLLIFDAPGNHGIWMKDMKFPIDIIWLDKELTIVSVEKDVSPQTYPKVFYPGEPASAVLEIKAGSFNSSGLKVGQRLELVD